MGEINADPVVKIQFCLPYAKQGNNAHPTEKDIESGYPDVPEILKTIQIGI